MCKRSKGGGQVAAQEAMRRTEPSVKGGVHQQATCQCKSNINASAVEKHSMHASGFSFVVPSPRRNRTVLRPI